MSPQTYPAEYLTAGPLPTALSRAMRTQLNAVLEMIGLALATRLDDLQRLYLVMARASALAMLRRVESLEENELHSPQTYPAEFLAASLPTALSRAVRKHLNDVLEMTALALATGLDDLQRLYLVIARTSALAVLRRVESLEENELHELAEEPQIRESLEVPLPC
jgi:hypothetical protein